MAGNLIKKKTGQEEMVGFGIIIVIVSIILVVFLWFFLSNSGKGGIESYEVESFVQSALQVSTTCKDPLQGYFDVRDLIYECYNNRLCGGNKESCEVLNLTLEGLLERGFSIGESTPLNGYWLDIVIRNESLVNLEKGNLTGNLKGFKESFSRGGNKIEVSLNVYTKP